LAQNIGADKASVSSAIAWLVEHHAIYIVPHEYRVGNEKRINSRGNVYQLTGIIELDGEIVQYLSLSPEALKSVWGELEELGDTKIVEIAAGEPHGSAAKVVNYNQSKVENYNPEDSQYIEDLKPERSLGKKKKERGGNEAVYISKVAQEATAFKDIGKPVSPDGDAEEDQSELEKYIVALTSTKRLAKTYRQAINRGVSYVNDSGELVEDKSAVVLWETEPEFRKFFLEKVYPSLRDKGLVKQKHVVARMTSSAVRAWYRKRHSPKKAKPQSTFDVSEYDIVTIDEARSEPND
jgi:hypothetical protein